MVGLGTLLAVAFGFWLVDLTVYRFDGWVLASLALLVVALGAGAAGGQAPKRARRLAGELARSGRPPNGELACSFTAGARTRSTAPPRRPRQRSWCR